MSEARRLLRLLLGVPEALAYGVGALALAAIIFRLSRRLFFPLDVATLLCGGVLASGLWLRRARGASTRSSWRVRAVAGAMLAASVSAAGMAMLTQGYDTAIPPQDRLARHLLPGEDCEADARGYRPMACLAPDFEEGGLRVSSAGLWGLDVESPKPEGLIRIVAVGASTTEGDQHRDPPESWPQGLRHRLEELAVGTDVEVLNAAVASYTSRDVLWQIETRVLALEPDIVLIYTGWNDFKCHQLTPAQRSGVRAFHERGDIEDLERLGPWFVAHREAFDRERRELLEYSSTRVRLLRSDPSYAQAAERVASWIGTDFELYDHLRGLAARRIHVWSPQDQDLRGEALFDASFVPEPFAENLGRIVASVQAAGAEPVLISLPHGFGVTDRIEGRLCDFAVLGATDWFRYHTDVVLPQIAQIAMQTGAGYVDLVALVTEEERVRFFRGSDGLHALRGGYLRFGELIAEELWRHR